MRVLMLSKACIVGIYQRKLEAIAADPAVDLYTLVPPSWRDERGETKLERLYTDGYDLIETPLRFNGNYHLHYYPEFSQHLARFKPDIVHVDEEPYNLATWLAIRAARRSGAKTLFFSWQNINRRYPFPFNRIEHEVLQTTDFAICGTQSAVNVWRAKGYTGPIAVIPQFGVDPALFTPIQRTKPDGAPIKIGYVGRLWHGKGINTLLNALGTLKDFAWELSIIGSGPEKQILTDLGHALGIAAQIDFTEWVTSSKMPGLMAALDILVLPSRTLPTWKEQYGRVLIEAMASGVVVVGSSSGAIPDVIGDAGVVFAEDDAAALATSIRQLLQAPQQRLELAHKGRARVLDHFTQHQVAEQTIRVYRTMLGKE